MGNLGAVGLMGSVVAADLIGGWSWTVWLLIPLALVLALVTALALGPAAEPPRRRQGGAGGVSRYLERRAGERPTDRQL